MKICPTCKSQYDGGEVFCPVDAARLVTGSQIDTNPGVVTDPYIGATIDRYKIIRRIGEGGMGVVYEAIHTVIEKRVAIKLLRKDFSSRHDVVERFRQEAKSASRIGHEHIVDISDFGETQSGDSYFVMEFLEGQDLANLLGRDGVLPVRRTIDIVVQCCRALGAAHGKGIVHRDMKPENVFLIRRDDNPDFVKIVDFGIAKMNEIETPGEPGRKLTKTGMIFGTPEYMSPEQAAGKSVDHRVDIYAVGVILFELLLGRVPFVGDSFMGILTQHMFEPVPPFGEVNSTVVVPVDLEAIILKALAKKPEERFQSMEQFADALVAVAQGRPADPTIVGVGRAVAPAKTDGRGVGLRVDDSDASPVASRKSTGEAIVPQKSRAGLVVALAITGVAVVTGITYALVSDGDGGADAGTNVVTTAVEIDAGPVAVDAGAPVVEIDAGFDAGPSTVALTIETRPSGAEVSIEGTETRCAPSPCTIEATVGVAITLRAESGRSNGTLEITPTQTMAVVIPLASSSRGQGGNESSTGRTTSMTGMSGDLRIPEIFR